jgi:hypothetical protein
MGIKQIIREAMEESSTSKIDGDIEKFKNREVKAKKIFTIKKIDKSVAYDFVKQHHYLGDAKFFSKFAYGLYHKDTDTLLGAATFSNPQGSATLKGWFGLTNKDQTVLELSRLVVLPSLNGTNATSYMLGNSLKHLKREGVRAVITLADDSRHIGSIYQVCNFDYYGLTDKKTDFYSYDDGGKVNPRGPTKEKQGVWVPRTRKHRYAYMLDDSLGCKYIKNDEKPKKDETGEYGCCDDTQVVHDKRHNVKYTCPKCTDSLDIV